MHDWPFGCLFVLVCVLPLFCLSCLAVLVLFACLIGGLRVLVWLMVCSFVVLCVV